MDVTWAVEILPAQWQHGTKTLAKTHFGVENNRENHSTSSARGCGRRHPEIASRERVVHSRSQLYALREHKGRRVS
jgi:hypothetical protein